MLMRWQTYANVSAQKDFDNSVLDNMKNLFQQGHVRPFGFVAVFLSP